MNPVYTEAPSESVPLSRDARRAGFVPVAAAGQTFGTPYFLISTLIAAIIPIIKLAIGLSHQNDCPVDQRISTYMVVAGICGLVLVGLSVLLAVTFMCLISDSTTLNIVATCGLCLNIISTVVLSVFIFIWFILGCVWVFGARKQVQFDYPSRSDYCHPVLYKWAFALLILTIVWACLQCCLSCIRTCCTTRNASTR